jgi:imidazolonepropionase-like amidohydrolase
MSASVRPSFVAVSRFGSGCAAFLAMMRRTLPGLVIAIVLATPVTAQQQITVIRGARILPVTAPPIESGIIVMQNGRIDSIGANVAVPDGATVFDGAGLTAVPGLFDAEGRDSGQVPATLGHGVSGVTGTMRTELIAGDFFDPFASDYRQKRALRDIIAWGVTTVNMKLLDNTVFDAVTSVIRLHAPATYEDHFLKYRAAVRINLGEAARSQEPDFPTTRMGIAALVRQEFVNAHEYRQEIEDALANDQTAPERNLKMEPLVSALEREIPVIIHAVEPMDIETALRLGEEFDLRLVLSGSSQALEEHVPALRARDVSVILGTYYASINSHTGEQMGFRYETAAMLSKNGVRVALGGLEGETMFLSLNAGIAVQSGMAYDAALQAITINPARMFGVEDRVGSLEVGKDADVVLYRGDPLEITSTVEQVFVSGRLVYDRAPFDPTYHNLIR